MSPPPCVRSLTETSGPVNLPTKPLPDHANLIAAGSLTSTRPIQRTPAAMVGPSPPLVPPFAPPEPPLLPPPLIPPLAPPPAGLPPLGAPEAAVPACPLELLPLVPPPLSDPP